MECIEHQTTTFLAPNDIINDIIDVQSFVYLGYIL